MVRGKGLYIIVAVNGFNVLNKKGRHHDLPDTDMEMEPKCAISLRLYRKPAARAYLRSARRIAR